jgi:transcriptional regulator with XRE-family HTH domain
MAVTGGTGTDICVRVGRRIAELRAARGITQQMLADLAGIERSHLARLESGEREAGLRMLEKVANALSVKPSSLLD